MFYHDDNQPVYGTLHDDVFLSFRGNDQIFAGRGDDLLIAYRNPDDFEFYGGRGNDTAEIYLEKGATIETFKMYGNVKIFHTSAGQDIKLVSVENVHFHFKKG